ncbi:MAG: hypothetical protein ABSB54_03165 [Acidimicrobiales bacterium]|jgi:hypothetical protein
MSAGTLAGVTRGWSLRRVVPRAEPWCAPDSRRILQLSLAAVWLFDGVLQLQPYMFTQAFGTGMIAPMAHGNPAVVADAITWSARVTAGHSMLAGTAFASIQLLIAVGIAWRPTVRAALTVSVVWSLGVWWIGEGAGDLFAGTASPLTGAPGAALLYALLAVLLWPSRSDDETAGGGFVADRPFGALPARLIWLVLWGGLGALSLSSGNRQPEAVRDAINTMATGQPHWLSSLDQAVAREVAGRGLEASVVVAVIFGLVALGIFAPPRMVRGVLILAAAVATAIWVVGEGFGGVFAGPATDPNSGPLLILLAAAFWPLRLSRPAAGPPAPATPGVSSAIIAAGARPELPTEMPTPGLTAGQR